MAIITTLPLLILFNISWIISFAFVFLVEDKNKKIPILFIALISSIFIVTYAPIEIRCIDCNCTDTEEVLMNYSYFNETLNESIDNYTWVNQSYSCVEVSRLGTFPIKELIYIHAFGFIPIELLLIIFFMLTGGFSSLQKVLKGRE